MVSVRHHRLQAIVYLILVGSVISFLLLEEQTGSRLVLAVLAVAAAVLSWTGRDRLLLALTALFAAASVLFGLLLGTAVPLWTTFPLLALVGSILFVWMGGGAGRSGDITRDEWLVGLGSGLLLVEVWWFLSGWPFDVRSKAALLSLSFYLLWTVWQGIRSGRPVAVRDWVVVGVWFVLVLLFVILTAEWYA